MKRAHLNRALQAMAALRPNGDGKLHRDGPRRPLGGGLPRPTVQGKPVPVLGQEAKWYRPLMRRLRSALALCTLPLFRHRDNAGG